ncbi:MAG: cobalamin-binding protein [Candidatus Dormibacteria bacterium]
MRIVSLLPSSTEICFAIGAGEELVAVTHECDHPDGARRLPVLTSNALDHDGSSADIDRHIRVASHAGSSIYHLAAQRLADLDPDLILTQELCHVCAVAYRQVEGAVRQLPGDVPVLSLEPRTLGEVIDTIVTVGRGTGHLQAAEQVARRLRTRIAAIASGRQPTAPPGVACIEWTDPVMTGGHWVPDMVAVAGGRDLLGVSGEPSRATPWDEVVTARPDVIVLMPCGFGLERTLERAVEITQRSGFADLPAAQSGRVIAVDGSSYFNRPGPRLVDGIELLNAGLRASPGDQLPAGAAWVPGALRR